MASDNNVGYPAQIAVGLITDGLPEIQTARCGESEGFLVSNLLIGDGFHWQQCREAFVPGSLHHLSPPQGNIHVVNMVDIEDYVLSVISSEMNPSAPLEFLKAHAIISRSWAVRKIMEKGESEVKGRIHADGISVDWEESDSHHGFDVCSDDHCQRYQGFPARIPEQAREAVESTRGMVLTAPDNSVADARFSKCCGGRTERFSSCWADADMTYLPVKEDSWCDLSDLTETERVGFLDTCLRNFDRKTEDFLTWSTTVDKVWLRDNIIARHGVDLGEIISLEALERGGSGRITRLMIRGRRGVLTVGKELAIRRLLARDCLRSSWFDAEDCGDHFRITGRGWGHGVGLCQIGAARMAREGYDFKSILEFYYPGATIRSFG
ncbi:MAG: SpoIID/LytB domain-containing protein [Muribaculaceae bacterium]|nr:SpoIID/LytB domain-containing protein [Muribaculaceae bacterium]